MDDALLKRWQLAAGALLTLVGLNLFIAGCIARLNLTDIAHVRHRGASPVLKMGEHVLEWECECTRCHPGAFTEDDDVGMPGRDICFECHEGLENSEDFELGGIYFDSGGSPKWTVVTELPDHVGFSHAKHASVFDCSECHGDILHDDYSNVDLAARFGNCRRCHSHEESSGNCAYCHGRLDSSRRPHSHVADWHYGHGVYVRDMGGISRTDRSCRSCHTSAYCTSCHSEEEPRDHTVFWKRAGHGLAADMDRERCLACHSEDRCQSCHLDRAPPMLPDADHYPPVLSGCTAFPDCHWREEFGHTVLTRNCLLCHK